MLELLSPVIWCGGTATSAQVRRWLHVTVDEEGTLSRFTTGDIPPRWRRPFSWEVPDGESRPSTSG